MNEPRTYLATDKMSDLICDNYSLLMLMSRFGISLGFGDKSVQDVCDFNGVDCPTFLAVANFISNEQRTEGKSPYSYEESHTTLSLPALMEYLKRAHTYYLEFNLPAIRRKLIEAIDCSATDGTAMLILRFYDEYVKEVERHMEHENRAVFTYVEQLLQGRLSEDYDIATFAGKHHSIEEKLKELKNILVKYYPEKVNGNLLNSVLFDIYNCEQDLASHCRVEDCLFVPAVARLEEQLQNRQEVSPKSTPSAQKPEQKENEPEALSQREKEVIACVVRGMTNKAIADRLFLSIHTVITHRRNIARKLQIHSPAGLTIYAIVNKLVELEEIKEML